jgi:WD40 repeat protein
MKNKTATRWILLLVTAGLSMIVNAQSVKGSGTSLRIMPQSGHSGEIYTASFSTDGKRIVTCSQDETAKVWDARTGKELLTLSGHTDAIPSASFSADGKRIVTGSGDKTAKVWDARTGKQLLTLSGHTDAIPSASFSSDGNRIVTGSFDMTAKVWDAHTGKELLTLSGHTSRVFSASFSSDGQRIITSSSDTTAKLWDAQTGKEILTLAGHKITVASASISRDGKRVVTSSIDKNAKVWDALSGKELLTLTGHTDWVFSASFSSDGNRIVTGSFDMTAKVWDALTGREILTLYGHTHQVFSASFSSDGNRIVTGSFDKTAKVWDARTGKELQTLTRMTQEPHLLDSIHRDVQIVTGSSDNTAKLWDGLKSRFLLALTGHTDGVVTGSFSLDGNRIVTSSKDKTAKVWDARTGKELLTLTGHTDWVIYATFSGDGKRIVTCSLDKTAKMWDAVTGKELLTLTGHSDSVSAASFSRDGKRIVTCSFDKTAKVWNAQTGEAIVTLTGHTRGVIHVSMSGDGKRIVTGSADNTAKVWDGLTGKELLTLSGHTDFINFAYFFVDDKRIVTGSSDTSRKIWEAETGTLLYSAYFGLDGGMLIVAPDGRYDSSQGLEPSFAHFVADTSYGPELVDWSQVNTRDYLVPGLQQLIEERKYLPGKIALADRKLPPEITILSSGATTRFVAKDQGGGIGEVQIYVGREVVKRLPKGTVKIGVPYEVKLDLAPSDLGLSIDVTASSEEGALFSPLQSDRSLDRGSNQSDARAASDNSGVRMVGLFIGSENYLLGGLKALTYAGDDAIEMAKAFAILAKGVDVKPEVYVLTDDAGATARLMELGVTPLLPTRENYEKVLSQIQKTAFSANDILMLYMSGHGVALGKDRNDFVYLTPAASTTDLEAIAAEKTRIGITGEDILGILREARVSKRMLILDTCSAGAVNQLLALSEKSEESDRKVAIATMSRETRSTQILLGSAKDYKSYEDPRFGHGVMTYALLESLRDASLSDGNDKNEIKSGAWFDAAKRRTENLALELGIEQSPLKAGQESFTIGRLASAQRAQIILQQPKKVIGRINITFENGAENEAFNEALFSSLATGASGKGASYAVSRASESPVALRVFGKYLTEGEVVILRLGIQEGRGETAKITELKPEIRTTKARAVEDARHAIEDFLSRKG